jgi:hypothetical protein
MYLLSKYGDLENTFPPNLTILVHFLQKLPLHPSHKIFLGHLSSKFHQEKKQVNIHPESCERKKKKSSKVLPSFI